MDRPPRLPCAGSGWWSLARWSAPVHLRPARATHQRRQWQGPRSADCGGFDPLGFPCPQHHSLVLVLGPYDVISDLRRRKKYAAAAAPNCPPHPICPPSSLYSRSKPANSARCSIPPSLLFSPLCSSSRPSALPPSTPSHYTRLPPAALDLRSDLPCASRQLPLYYLTTARPCPRPSTTTHHCFLCLPTRIPHIQGLFPETLSNLQRRHTRRAASPELTQTRGCVRRPPAPGSAPPKSSSLPP